MTTTRAVVGAVLVLGVLLLVNSWTAAGGQVAPYEGGGESRELTLEGDGSPQGATIVVLGDGFAANGPVEFSLTLNATGATTYTADHAADEAGRVRISLVLVDPIGPGSYTVRVSGQTPDGRVHRQTVSLTVVGADPGATVTPVPTPTPVVVEEDSTAQAPSATCAGVTATIVGTTGDDDLEGGPGADVIVGLGGNDTIDGLGGNDIICGGSGNDTITGGTGRDQIFGQGGRDIIRGNGGADTIVGGSGNDRIWGGGKADRIRGNGGQDRLKGGGGADKLWGGGKADIIWGNGGRDTLRGNGGADDLRGGKGSDRCIGGNGPDMMSDCER